MTVMPRAPRRGCAYGNCPRLAVEGSLYCEEHKKLKAKQYDMYKRSPDKHKKYGRAWAKVRERYVREHPFCELCYKEGRMTPVEEVHHIIPVKQGGTHNPENLMSLCRHHHKQIHREEIGDR